MEKAILLVDDEAIILMSLRRELRTALGAGYRYEIAYNAAEGLAVIDSLEAEGVTVVLVISDWLMPGMKGDAFLEEARRRHPALKTVMLSGQADPATVERLGAEGWLDAFFGKPWRTEKLVEACRRLLG